MESKDEVSDTDSGIILQSGECLGEIPQPQAPGGWLSLPKLMEGGDREVSAGGSREIAEDLRDTQTFSLGGSGWSLVLNRDPTVQL